MSRTFRNNRPRHGWRWLNATKEKGDSKPFSSRYKTTDSKMNWRCHCEYCVDGWLHKHVRRNHPMYKGEIEDGLLHNLQSDDEAYGSHPAGD